MTLGKIDKIKLNRMFQAGKTQRECAKVFGVSEAAISQVKKELNLNVIKSVALENAHKVVTKNLNSIEQLQKINDQANSLLDRAMMVVRGESVADPQTSEATQDIALKAMKEIRGQLSLQLDIFKTLYDVEAIAQFQQEVLSIIGEVNEDVRDRIIQRLKEGGALRASITVA